MTKEAQYYKKLEDNKVQCLLCFHYCTLNEGQTGICLGRTNVDGTLIAENYGRTVTLAVDPIEKKPLYHFHPSKKILSTAGNVCNLKCSFCQNWNISQKKINTQYVSPEELVETTLRNGSFGAAFTYTEPLMWFEYVKDSAKLLRDKNLKTVLISNGTINEEPFLEIAPLIDAMNIDLKAFSQDFYKRLCKGDLESVKKTIINAEKNNIHLEITTLLITGENDSSQEIEDLTDFIASVNANIPLHFSRYFPQYRLTNPSTPSASLHKAFEIAKKKLTYVYIGNTADKLGKNTYCPSCSNLLIERTGYYTKISGIKNSKCLKCGENVPYIIGADV